MSEGGVRTSQEQTEDEADYRRLSTKELLVLAERGDEDAISELERRRGKTEN